jgi:hypothetical protein
MRTYLAEKKAAAKNAQPLLKVWRTVEPKAAVDIFGWIDWIVTCDLPFSTCEKEKYREYAKVDGISIEILQS